MPPPSILLRAVMHAQLSGTADFITPIVPMPATIVCTRGHINHLAPRILRLDRHSLTTRIAAETIARGNSIATVSPDRLKGLFSYSGFDDPSDDLPVSSPLPYIRIFLTFAATTVFIDRIAFTYVYPSGVKQHEGHDVSMRAVANLAEQRCPHLATFQLGWRSKMPTEQCGALPVPAQGCRLRHVYLHGKSDASTLNSIRISNTMSLAHLFLMGDVEDGAAVKAAFESPSARRLQSLSLSCAKLTGHAVFNGLSAETLESLRLWNLPNNSAITGSLTFFISAARRLVNLALMMSERGACAATLNPLVGTADGNKSSSLPLLCLRILHNADSQDERPLYLLAFPNLVSLLIGTQCFRGLPSSSSPSPIVCPFPQMVHLSLMASRIGMHSKRGAVLLGRFISPMRNLQILNLARCDIGTNAGVDEDEAEELEHFAWYNVITQELLPNLRELSFNGNLKINTEMHLWKSPPRGITSLDLNDAPVSVESASVFLPLLASSLIRLNIEFTKITPSATTTVQSVVASAVVLLNKCEQLEELKIKKLPLRGALKSAPFKLTKLRRLNLSSDSEYNDDDLDVISSSSLSKSLQSFSGHSDLSVPTAAPPKVPSATGFQRFAERCGVLGEVTIDLFDCNDEMNEFFKNQVATILRKAGVAQVTVN